MKRLTALALVLALVACKQDQPAPSQKIAKAADELIAKASGAPPAIMLGEGQFAPRDECAEIPGASEFREQLAQVVSDRDVEGLVTLVANDVRLNFGGGVGANLLRTHLTQPDRNLWDELEDMLTLGCAQNDQGGITIPWYFDQDFGGIDPMKGMIVTGENVPLRADVTEDAEELKTLSWDVVELAGEYRPEQPFQKVILNGKTEGYIATDKLRSLTGYRLIASSRNGKWSITSLVAGE
ncbi:hypothetical protein [Croceicoccus estronivorus]|uniref:hypothetical protein n=1 Tax=Croceicoccus estronivorus TaxID=1172626 RepID=UPI000A77D1A5|nr:hypothetical protein [Croceicoccus estronivorus]